ncbi:MAG: YgjV family protein [Clostridia bacterium]|nr:YgjV family protein [Clostridia bacterium]
MFFIISQIVVVISDILCAIGLLSKPKKMFLIFMILSSITYAAHFLFLGDGYSGAISVIVSMFVSIAIYYLEKYNKDKYKKWVVIGSLILMIPLTALVWNGVLTLLPVLGLACFLTGITLNNVTFSKVGSFINNSLSVTYLFLVGSTFGAWLGVGLVICAFAGIFISIYEQKKNKAINGSVNEFEKRI